MTQAASAPPKPPRLGFGAKSLYGVGSIAFGVSTLGLSSSVLQPYLNRVIGLPALWVGTAIMLTLMLDAVIDPVIGHISDKLRTRWGRRHPLMYLSVPLVAVACYAFWNTPAEWGPARAGPILILLLMLLRLAISLYEVPSQALAPELAPDYNDRTSLFSFRFFFGVVGGLGMNVLLYRVFLSPEHGGILSRQGYGAYGLVAGLVMAISIFMSSIGTHRHIKTLVQPPVRKVPTAQVAREVWGTITNPSLVVVMVSGLCSGVSMGLSSALSQYFYVEMWGMDSKGVSLIGLAGVAASLFGVALAAPSSALMGKKRAMLTLFSISVVTTALPQSLRLLGLAPANSSPWLIPFLVADFFVATTLAITGFIIISSMIADVVEDAAVKTGVRSEGLLFAANGLLNKFTSGIGVFLSGVLLTVVAFPTHAAPGSVNPEIMRHLSLLYLPVTAGMSALSVAVLALYRIDRQTHENNLATLAQAAALAERGEEAEGRSMVAGPGGLD
jgi:GPH family glycoside/pentoside/hexuronide:cation symporter